MIPSDPGGFRALATHAAITPVPGLTLGGFAARTGAATGTHAPLEANMLLLEDPSGLRVLWISIDALAIGEHLREAIVTAIARRPGLRVDEVIIVASHTHSAPSGWCGTIHPVLPAEEDIADIIRVAEVIGERVSAAANAGIHPVRLEYACTEIVDVATNRHSPDGPHDPSSLVLAVRTDSGRLLAVMFDFACHPTVLGPENALYSPDWVHGARARIRTGESADPRTPVLFLPGCSGDASARFTRRDRSTGEADRLGAKVGEQISTALAQTTAVHGPLSIRRQTITVPVHTREPAASGASEEISNLGGRVAESLAEGIRSARAMAESDLPTRMEIRTTRVSIPPLSWLHTPFEIAASLRDMIAANDAMCRVIGYTDGYLGYLADDASHNAGDYEALSSFFGAHDTNELAVRLSKAGVERRS
ncbi:neutral/alkaline non-lysosomal ceramidase N-terminal domain-containing protein [Microbacterium sp. A94]|uniref:neutral/alkaline non-lysosomal ceramidase N-terminal domain-containing protein n=1 Tax=Microbacterium sp. A94 TaxID=3450717 RepID=UPI003F4388FA